ncbi:MAG: glycosyltransferase [Anaerolineae bacterium]|jgi:chlorobactene glucosyltransferase|nr:glycosyltransferase [Anaerolineae bacterium]MBT7190595.1 glycosyltransferase [Anaerolineae bacterium]MBT7990013.1 glycosyltransferase [Anaerolineae bacterium]
MFLSTFLLILGIIILRWLHNQHHTDTLSAPENLPEKNAPLISICIPARNEERNIRRCVESLLAQTYPNIEIIILEDRSTDSTAQILDELSKEDARLKIISGEALPLGWAGKPHALTQASASAWGEWLCFVDADTFVAPDALSVVYANALKADADLFTIFTHQEMETFWERTILPLVMTALSAGFSPQKVNDPNSDIAIANGQFIFIKRSVYDAIGGHAAIKGSIVEDKDLAVLTKSSGYKLIIADGSDYVRTRMYTSLPEMWEGWTKNIYLGLRDDPRLAVLGVFGAFLAICAALLLPLWVGIGVYLTVSNPNQESAVILIEALLLWGYLIYWRIQANKGTDVPAWYALTAPFGAGVFAAMMFTSAFKVISGKGVTWKGRKYQR